MATTEEVLAKLTETLAEVSAQTTKIDGINTLMDGMRARIEELLASIGGVPPEVSERIGLLFDELKANTARIDEAIAENTTPEEPPVE